MKLLLTGGTGFFGKALLRHYLSKEFVSYSEIVVLSRNPDLFLASFPEFSGHSITFLEGDIQQRESLPWGHSITPLQRYG